MATTDRGSGGHLPNAATLTSMILGDLRASFRHFGKGRPRKSKHHTLSQSVPPSFGKNCQVSRRIQNRPASRFAGAWVTYATYETDMHGFQGDFGGFSRRLKPAPKIAISLIISTYRLSVRHAESSHRVHLKPSNRLASQIRAATSGVSSSSRLRRGAARAWRARISAVMERDAERCGCGIHP